MERKIFFIVPHSGNGKTGQVFQTYSSRSTCPASCPFKGAGCYAENFRCLANWKKCDGPTAAGLEDLAAALHAARRTTAAPGAIVRHNVAGDMAIAGSDFLDARLVAGLTKVYAAAGAAAYTYTHCAAVERNFRIAEKAVAGGFCINFSCESMKKADKVMGRGLPAVLACSSFEKLPAHTPAGRRIIPCPAQAKGAHCSNCRLCARADRAFIIAFEAHGCRAKAAKAAIIAAGGL